MEITKAVKPFIRRGANTCGNIVYIMFTVSNTFCLRSGQSESSPLVLFFSLIILWKVQEAQIKDTSIYIKTKSIRIFSTIDGDQILLSSVVVLLPLKQSVANTHILMHRNKI